MSFDGNDGAEGQRRHVEAGSPNIPAVIVDGVAHAIHHPAQIGSFLGLELGTDTSVVGMCWDIHGMLERWLEMIEPVPFEVLLEPTESRQRSIRNLTVNVLRPLGYVPDAWLHHDFTWYTGEADLQQEALLRDHAALLSWATDRTRDFAMFVLDHDPVMDEQDPRLTSNLHEMSFSTLINAQRFHVGFHFRQVVAHLRGRGFDHVEPLPQGLVEALSLPSQLY